MHGEQAYLDLLINIIDNGTYRKPDDETGRYELFGQPLKFDLSNNSFPLMTTKKVFHRSLAIEMLWFISGQQNTDLLKENKVGIWDIWADEETGCVGPLYGYQWRHWHVEDHPIIRERNGGKEEIDQLAQVMDSLRHRPEARSHMITAWRPDHLKAMSIKPCHILLQFYRVGDEVSLMLNQRSCDMFLGVPFNIAQYSLLLHMVAHQLDCKAKEFTWIGGDVHIYEDHVDQVKTQLEQPILPPPTIKFNRKPDSIFDYKYEDFEVVDYNHGPRLKGDVSEQGTPGLGACF